MSKGLFNKDKPTNVSKELFFHFINENGMAYLQKSDHEMLIHMVAISIPYIWIRLMINWYNIHACSLPIKARAMTTD